MPGYEDPRDIRDQSLEELGHIARFLREREDLDQPLTVLIGGWAVHAYNPWYGSIDIDLITNGRTRNSLSQHMISARRFERRRNFDDARSVEKRVTQVKKITLDFGTREQPDPFEGREERLDYGIIDGRTRIMRLGSEQIAVPERGHLLMLKMKAGWDRRHRIANDCSHDIEWERGKLLKDQADILALIDPGAGGMEIDIAAFGRLMEIYPFLLSVLEDIQQADEAIKFYGRMNIAQARETISQIMELAR